MSAEFSLNRILPQPVCTLVFEYVPFFPDWCQYERSKQVVCLLFSEISALFRGFDDLAKALDASPNAVNLRIKRFAQMKQELTFKAPNNEWRDLNHRDMQQEKTKLKPLLPSDAETLTKRIEKNATSLTNQEKPLYSMGWIFYKPAPCYINELVVKAINEKSTDILLPSITKRLIECGALKQTGDKVEAVKEETSK